MTKMNVDFLSYFKCGAVALAVSVALAPVAVMADDDYINPTYAMCSVHAYNAGLTENPSDANAKQAIKDAIALKTTFMTQQLQAQYEYMEAMVTRLKAQLKKSVLSAQLQAAGASSGSSGSSSGPALAGAENCRIAGDTTAVMECLNRNVDRIKQATQNGENVLAKRQITTDLETLRMYDTLEKVKEGENSIKYSEAYYEAKLKCEKASVARDIDNCTDYIKVCISKNLEEIKKENARITSGYRY